MAENINGIIGAIAEKASADADKIIALAEQYAAAKIADAEREAERIRAAAAEDWEIILQSSTEVGKISR